jgi:hypothetical protein
MRYLATSIATFLFVSVGLVIGMQFRFFREVDEEQSLE